MQQESLTQQAVLVLLVLKYLSPTRPFSLPLSFSPGRRFLRAVTLLMQSL